MRQPSQPRPSAQLQHSATEEDVVDDQENGRTDAGDREAVKTVHTEHALVRAAEEVEHPAADECADDTEQNIDDGAFARGADDLAGNQAQPDPEQYPHEYRHATLRAPATLCPTRREQPSPPKRPDDINRQGHGAWRLHPMSRPSATRAKFSGWGFG